MDGLCLVGDRISWGISSLGESRRIAVGERQQATPRSPLNLYCDLPSFIPLALLPHIPPSTPQPLLLAASSALPTPIAQLTLIPLEPPPRCLPLDPFTPSLHQQTLVPTMATTHVIGSSNPSAHLTSSGSHSSSSSNIVGVHYKVGKKIGEGSFGVIFEGLYIYAQSAR